MLWLVLSFTFSARVRYKVLGSEFVLRLRLGVRVMFSLEQRLDVNVNVTKFQRRVLGSMLRLGIRVISYNPNT